VRQGKFFEIALNGGLTKEQAHAEVEKMAREVLTNPVIEEFRFYRRSLILRSSRSIYVLVDL